MQELAEHIAEQLGDVIQTQNIRLGELMLTVRREDIVKVLTFLRDDSACDFKILLDVCGVDFPDRKSVV